MWMLILLIAAGVISLSWVGYTIFTRLLKDIDTYEELMEEDF